MKSIIRKRKKKERKKHQRQSLFPKEKEEILNFIDFMIFSSYQKPKIIFWQVVLDRLNF